MIASILGLGVVFGVAVLFPGLRSFSVEGVPPAPIPDPPPGPSDDAPPPPQPAAGLGFPGRGTIGR